MDRIMSFEVEGFNVVDDYSDAQLAIVEIFVCHDGNNLHNMPIDISVLKAAKKTLKNKFLVAGYDGEDFEGHEPDEVIVGFFPESSKMDFIEKDGKTYLVAQAIMSKIYAKWAYDVFVEENNRAVSMEITVLETEVYEDDNLEYIKEFIFNGVTLLGKTHSPACEGADASIIKFSKENALKIYSKHFRDSNKIKEDFVKDMNLAKNSGKEDKDNMEKDVENVEMEEEKMETPESDDTTLMEKPEVEPEEEKMESEEESDKEAKEDEKSDKETEEEDEEDKSFEGEESQSLTVEQKYEVFRAAVADTLKVCGYVESFDDESLYIYEWEEGFTYRYKYTLTGITVEIDESSKERVMRGGYVTFAEAKENAIKAEVLETEISELKTKLSNYETSEKDGTVEGILSEVVDLISSEQMSDLREESKNYSLEDLTVFENKVKAVAFENVKNVKNTETFTRMTINKIEEQSSKYTW